MEGLQLTLTKEQAALLAPILRQILPVDPLRVTDKLEASQPQPGQTPSQTQPSVIPVLPSELPSISTSEDHSSYSYKSNDKQMQTAEGGSDEEVATVEAEQRKEILTDDVSDEPSSCESGAGNFTVQDLLQKKKRNTKSTRAQNFLNVRIVLSSSMHACTPIYVLNTPPCCS